MKLLSKWWKRNPKLIGISAYYIFRTLAFTLRVKVQVHGGIDRAQPYLFAFWHGKQLLPSLLAVNYGFTHNTCAMVSPSRDGSLLTAYLNKAGFQIIRGSSRDNGYAALLNLKSKLHQNVSVSFAVDGPIGPQYSIKPGIIYLAKKTGLPIVPIGTAFSNAWIFKKAWDKFQIPKPFARARLVLGDPFFVPDNMTIEEALEQLGEKLHVVEQQAYKLI